MKRTAKVFIIEPHGKGWRIFWSKKSSGVLNFNNGLRCRDLLKGIEKFVDITVRAEGRVTTVDCDDLKQCTQYIRDNLLSKP